ncbi:MAG: hypothetical protein IIB59_04020 [Planctomycetes bacterium]|nr:hypothetical protein [Planctomycetota bacterium]
MTNNILVFVEQRQGRILPASFQLLTLAGKLAAETGGQAEACLIGDSVGGLTSEVAAYGAKKIYTVEDGELALYRAQPYTAALCAVIDAADPKTVLIPTTFMGRDLASRVGARKRAALAIDCTELKLDGADLVILAMHIYKQPMEPAIGNERFALAEYMKSRPRHVHAGPDVWTPTSKVWPQAFRADKVHPNEMGAEIMAHHWFETLLKHDGREVPSWSRQEMPRGRTGFVTGPGQVANLPYEPAHVAPSCRDHRLGSAAAAVDSPEGV